MAPGDASVNFDCFQFTGREIKRLMRQYKVTIRDLAQRMQITIKRIRYIRKHGIKGHAACDWFEAITGSLSPRMRGAYLQRMNHDCN
jgi:hypothetical protein